MLAGATALRVGTAAATAAAGRSSGRGAAALARALAGRPGSHGRVGGSGAASAAPGRLACSLAGGALAPPNSDFGCRPRVAGGGPRAPLFPRDARGNPAGRPLGAVTLPLVSPALAVGDLCARGETNVIAILLQPPGIGAVNQRVSPLVVGAHQPLSGATLSVVACHPLALPRRTMMPVAVRLRRLRWSRSRFRCPCAMALASAPTMRTGGAMPSTSRKECANSAPGRGQTFPDGPDLGQRPAAASIDAEGREGPREPPCSEKPQFTFARSVRRGAHDREGTFQELVPLFADPLQVRRTGTVGWMPIP